MCEKLSLPWRKVRERRGQDILWYLWSGLKSPLFGRSKMAAFENHLIAEPKHILEKKNAYYRFLEESKTAGRILEEFGLEGEDAYHQWACAGAPEFRESPVKCGGKVL